MAVRRSVQEVPGVRTVAADVRDPAAIRALVEPGAVCAWLVPPTGAERAIAEALRGVRRIVYVSSTGVYGPARGAWVDESWPIAPETEAGKARARAEADIRAAGIETVVLRAAGIYGPGRGVVARLRAGTMRIVGDGSAHTSRVHVEDLAAAIVLAGEAAAPGDVYNVADRDPCTLAEHADGAADLLGLPRPPRVAAAGVDPEVAGMLLADRRIDAGKLTRELGWAPRYPSWRDSITAG